jgi:hypothetical protein
MLMRYFIALLLQAIFFAGELWANDLHRDLKRVQAEIKKIEAQLDEMVAQSPREELSILRSPLNSLSAVDQDNIRELVCNCISATDGYYCSSWEMESFNQAILMLKTFISTNCELSEEVENLLQVTEKIKEFIDNHKGIERRRNAFLEVLVYTIPAIGHNSGRWCITQPLHQIFEESQALSARASAASNDPYRIVACMNEEANEILRDIAAQLVKLRRLSSSFSTCITQVDDTLRVKLNSSDTSDNQKIRINEKKEYLIQTIRVINNFFKQCEDVSNESESTMRKLSECFSNYLSKKLAG